MTTDWISTVQTIAIAVQAIATVVLFFVTLQLSRATRAMADSSQALVDANKKPHVLVKLKPWPEDPDFMNLVLENVGRGTALNVTFQLESEEDLLEEYKIQLRGVKTPIPFFSSGESESYFLTLKEYLPRHSAGTSPHPLRVNTVYGDLDGHGYGEMLEIDLRQFSHIQFGDLARVRHMRLLEELVSAVKALSKEGRP